MGPVAGQQFRYKQRGFFFVFKGINVSTGPFVAFFFHFLRVKEGMGIQGGVKLVYSLGYSASPEGKKQTPPSLALLLALCPVCVHLILFFKFF